MSDDTPTPETDAQVFGCRTYVGTRLEYTHAVSADFARQLERRCAALEALARYDLAVLEESRDLLGDLDGGWLQDKAEEFGLLVLVEVTERCGEHCRCAEYGDFPQECLRYSEEVRQRIAEATRIEKEE